MEEERQEVGGGGRGRNDEGSVECAESNERIH